MPATLLVDNRAFGGGLGEGRRAATTTRVETGASWSRRMSRDWRQPCRVAAAPKAGIARSVSITKGLSSPGFGWPRGK